MAKCRHRLGMVLRCQVLHPVVASFRSSTSSGVMAIAEFTLFFPRPSWWGARDTETGWDEHHRVSAAPAKICTSTGALLRAAGASARSVARTFRAVSYASRNSARGRGNTNKLTAWRAQRYSCAQPRSLLPRTCHAQTRARTLRSLWPASNQRYSASAIEGPEYWRRANIPAGTTVITARQSWHA